MNILAIEAAQFSLSLALMINGKIVCENRCRDVYQQDAVIVPSIEKMMLDHSLSFEQLDYIATTRGPGSFTGLRMALATTIALSTATEVPAVGIPTFDLIYELGKNEIGIYRSILIALESKRAELYFQQYIDGIIAKTFMSLPQSLSDHINLNEINCIFVNDEKYLQSFNSTFCKLISLQASDLCQFVLNNVSADRLNHYPCAPLYNRPADAIPLSK